MNIFDDATHQMLMKFFDKKIKDAEQEIASTGTLSEEHAIPLILKSHSNHILHLDTELTELRKVMNQRFYQLNVGLTPGFTIIAFLIILFGFLFFANSKFALN